MSASDHLSPEQFRRKVSPGVHGELRTDLESNGDDAGYHLDGPHLVIHDPSKALSVLESREDILDDRAGFGDKGASAKKRALSKVIDEMHDHYFGGQ